MVAFTENALFLADVWGVDVQCDYFKECLRKVREEHAEIATLV